jgi:hypothetical protein
VTFSIGGEPIRSRQRERPYCWCRVRAWPHGCAFCQSNLTAWADFFSDFNILFPLFHQPSFEVLFEQQYSDNPPVQSGWYAAFNMVLAIACRLRISHTPPPPEEDDGSPTRHIREAWGYFRNAAAVLTELFLRNTDLISIQAILAMVGDCV